IPDSRAGAIRAIAETSDHLGRGDADDPDAGRDGHARVPVLSDRDPVLGLMDLDWVDAAFERLNSAFASQPDVLHAVGCQALPLRSVLHRCAEAGAVCEVASPGELERALEAGLAPEAIVFDSPAKTWTELRRAVDLGVSINIDNFDELARLDTILAERRPGPASAEVPRPASARIGIRINTQSGTGAIGSLSTATETAKFGIGLSDPGARESLIEAYLARPWLNQIHVHSGSQGISLDKAAVGIRAAVELAEEINARAASESTTVPETSTSVRRDSQSPTAPDRRRVTR